MGNAGFAYTIDRPTCGGGLYMMDINNPLDPVFVGCAKGGDHGTHDTQCVTYTDPVNPVEVGTFDTTPYLDGPGFSGAWSTYPFFESGTVIVTSKREGMFLLSGKKKTEL